jgi:hypothetical protein
VRELLEKLAKMRVNCTAPSAICGAQVEAVGAVRRARSSGIKQVDNEIGVATCIATHRTKTWKVEHREQLLTL